MIQHPIELYYDIAFSRIFYANEYGITLLLGEITFKIDFIKVL
mgnify:CR=1 FL=1